MGNGNQHFGDFQVDIYKAGLRGIVPRFPVDFASLERQAGVILPPWIYSYVAGGCGDEFTQRKNVEAFQNFGLVPRMLNGGPNRDLSVSLFGRQLRAPIFLCPIGVLGICSQDFHGDLRTAEACVQTDIPMMVSTLTMDPMEDIARTLGTTPKYFQLYFPKDRELALSFIRRAERAGFDAISVTLDTWVTGWRPRDLNFANFPQLRGHCLANYFTDEHFIRRLKQPPEEDLVAAAHEWINVFGAHLTWDDIRWLRENTRLPLIVKGICHPDDARRAVDHGVNAIQCSNHGGRQANGGLSALGMLEDVVKAAQGTPVLFDSGVRSGSDVVKALAMGATSVGIGRPYAYALAVGGTEGVVHFLKSILAEADLLMAIDGYPTIADLRNAGLTKSR
ncbi:alpha-hydroxy-acid oxidizing protein [Paraburkholderia sediminicola]|uniref:alpha-hydroxy-acid oxidizing protein n=1 Tax=Paraburkholderia sediminicola TaxID=458836 RepID=UPI0038BD9349